MSETISILIWRVIAVEESLVANWARDLMVVDVMAQLPPLPN